MATINITYTVGGAITATSGVFSQHEPIEVSLELKGTTEACSVSMAFDDWEFHLVPFGNKRYGLDFSRAMRKATKGARIGNAKTYEYRIKVTTESGQTYTSAAKSVTIATSNLGTYGEDELDRAFQGVRNG